MQGGMLAYINSNGLNTVSRPSKRVIFDHQWISSPGAPCGPFNHYFSRRCLVGNKAANGLDFGLNMHAVCFQLLGGFVVGDVIHGTAYTEQ